MKKNPKKKEFILDTPNRCRSTQGLNPNMFVLYLVKYLDLWINLCNNFCSSLCSVLGPVSLTVYSLIYHHRVECYTHKLCNLLHQKHDWTCGFVRRRQERERRSPVCKKNLCLHLFFVFLLEHYQVYHQGRSTKFWSLYIGIIFEHLSISSAFHLTMFVDPVYSDHF